MSDNSVVMIGKCSLLLCSVVIGGSEASTGNADSNSSLSLACMPPDSTGGIVQNKTWVVNMLGLQTSRTAFPKEQSEAIKSAFPHSASLAPNALYDKPECRKFRRERTNDRIAEVEGWGKTEEAKSDLGGLYFALGAFDLRAQNKTALEHFTKSASHGNPWGIVFMLTLHAVEARRNNNQEELNKCLYLLYREFVLNHCDLNKVNSNVVTYLDMLTAPNTSERCLLEGYELLVDWFAKNDRPCGDALGVVKCAS